MAWAFKTMPRPIYAPGIDTVHILQGTGWTGAENLASHWFSILVLAVIWGEEICIQGTGNGHV